MDEKKKEAQEEKKEVATQSRNMVADLSNGIYSTSDTFKLACSMAKGLASSTIVPQQFQRNEGNCLIALELANRFNTSPMMIMQNTHIIQGKPSFSSQFMIAMVNASGRYDHELMFDETKDKDGKPFGCICWTEKDGRRIEGMEVNMDMAKAEGWLSKNGSKWKTLPGLMLRYRAAAFFVRLNCPELALGFYTQEEMLDNDFNQKQQSGASLNSILKDDDTDSIDVESEIIE